MNAKKLGFGAGLAGAGLLAARSFSPKLHEHCQSMCSEKSGGASRGEEPQAPAKRDCCSQTTPDAAESSDQLAGTTTVWRTYPGAPAR